MKAGISTASLYLRRETEDAISAIKELGSESIEIFLGTYYEVRPEFAKKYCPRAEGMEVAAVHSLSTSFEPQLFNASRRVRGDGFYWLDQILRSAQLFGAKKYSFHGYIARRCGGENWDEIAGYMRGICEFASRYGVDICLENVSWGAYNRPGVFRELKSRCPALAGVLDLKQARRSGYPVNMYIEDMSGAMSHVHLTDVTECGKMCLPGTGITDFEELFKRLKGAGFDGAALIEAYPPDYGEERELKESLDYICEIIYKLN